MFTHQSCLLLQVFLWIALDHSKSTEPKMDLQIICAQHIHLVPQFSEGGTLQSVDQYDKLKFIRSVGQEKEGTELEMKFDYNLECKIVES